MRLTVAVLLLRAVVAEPAQQVSGYFGESVTLLAGADPTWKLFSVDWSIFSNNTWIATFRNGVENSHRFWRYLGRLHLNTTTGDLVISNLSIEDAIQYTAFFESTTRKQGQRTVQLQVIKRLEKPEIDTLLSFPVNGKCIIGLKCSSQVPNVRLTWQTDSSINSTLWIDSMHKSTSVLWTFWGLNSEANFTCLARDDLETSWSFVTKRCNEMMNPAHAGHNKPERCIGYMFLGIFLVILVGAIFYIMRRKASSDKGWASEAS